MTKEKLRETRGDLEKRNEEAAILEAKSIECLQQKLKKDQQLEKALDDA